MSSETVGVGGNVFTAVYDTAAMDRHVRNWSDGAVGWDDLPPQGKARVAHRAQHPARIGGGVVKNTTVAGLHDDLAEGINPELASLPKADALVVGNDNTATATTDSSLGSQVATIDLADAATVDNTGTFTYVIDSTEANGFTLREAGVTSTTDTLWNRALLSPEVAKDSTKIVVIDVEVTYSDV